MAGEKQAVGTPMSRVDGRLKVTGGARYTAEFQVKDVSYGVLVLSTVAKGRVTRIDTAAAAKAPGVLAVITHQSAGKVVLPEKAKALVDPEVGRPLQPLQDDQVHYHGQPVAVVVADTFELEDVPEGTRLRITESGFDQIPIERRAEAFENNSRGWEGQTQNIAKYLSQNP